jgi:hypothetical protein
MASKSTQDRALDLLGQGFSVDIVSSAIGVSPSYISQLLSDPIFAAKVAELRYDSLIKHNERDMSYDEIEDALLRKMKDLLPFMMKPMEVLKAIQVVNQAKRRGSSAPEQISGQQTVVQLTIPVSVINQFSKPSVEVNVNNQIVKVDEQDLTTIQSVSLETLLASNKSKPLLLERQNHVYAEPPTVNSVNSHN